MSIWVFRAGKSGEYEKKFLDEGKIILTWEALNVDLRSYKDKTELLDGIREIYLDQKERTLINWMSQIWPIAHSVEVGDWVVLPSKFSRTINFGKVTGEYKFNSKGPDPFFHSRTVEWFARDIPRDRFDQDILYSMGAFLTVFKVTKNNAEKRIKEMEKHGWEVKSGKPTVVIDDTLESADVDLDEIIADQISTLIIQKFKGHRMEELINDILRAKGFTTYRSPEGADNGVDLLASSGILGFGSPKICVQVKTNDSPVDRPTLDQLIGTMSNFNAEFGLLVSWNGFKSSVTNVIPKHFFKVRLWESKQILEEIFINYDKLSDDIKSEIPLKRVWMLNQKDGE